MYSSPIGFIDSGSGGLSVWSAVTKLVPEESTIYIGDHLHSPYGEKSTRYIRKRIHALISYLISRHVKVVVIACNTATVAGIDEYRKSFPLLPIVGVVPVVKTASAESKTKVFGVISTPYTASSVYQKQLLKKFAKDCTVLNIGSPNLVTYIEQGELQSDRVLDELKRDLMGIVASGADIIALGCTHFPFLETQIRAIVGGSVRILDSGGAVARHVKRILDHNNVRATNSAPTHVFLTTGDSRRFESIGSTLLGKQIYAKTITI